MKRMNVILDEEALERERHATGERTYSATINRALIEVARIEILRDGIDRIEHTSFWPGYVAEFGPNPPVTEEQMKRLRRSARVVRAPRSKKP
jgi:hypothetical protein